MHGEIRHTRGLALGAFVLGLSLLLCAQGQLGAAQGALLLTAALAVFAGFGEAKWVVALCHPFASAWILAEANPLDAKALFLGFLAIVLAPAVVQQLRRGLTLVLADLWAFGSRLHQNRTRMIAVAVLATVLVLPALS